MVEGNLTKEEAYKEMMNGKKITHTYFSNEEYIHMPYPRDITSEEGYDFNEWWTIDADWGANYISKSFERPWRIYEE